MYSTIGVGWPAPIGQAPGGSQPSAGLAHRLSRDLRGIERLRREIAAQGKEPPAGLARNLHRDLYAAKPRSQGRHPGRHLRWPARRGSHLAGPEVACLS
jgi:hypothetical protein